MLSTSVALNLLASLGIFVMGLKYVRAEPPLDYHAEIMKDQNTSAETLMVLGALYKAMGGGFIALAFVVAILAVFGVWNDVFWAKLAILIGALVAGGFTALGARTVEISTGVRTPWRIALGLTAVSTVAFILSVI